MADKQIINGKECRYWFRLNPSDYRKCSLRGENDNCDEIKDCFVKELLGKLALKEQECEELKKKCERLKNELSTYGATGICETCTEKSVLKCDQLEKENEKLKKKLQAQRNFTAQEEKKKIKRKEQECEEINLTNERLVAEKYTMNEEILKLKQELNELSSCLEQANGKKYAYKQALDEIENLCRNESCSPCRELGEDFYCDECHNKIILDIINEAKKK